MTRIQQDLVGEMQQMRRDGLYKSERVITTPQRVRIEVGGEQQVMTFCANNYLGLADDPRIIASARDALDRWGFGIASVRFICGTQEIHKQLELAVSKMLGTEDTILYSSCFDANGGLFETLLGPDDAVISDELNHASIIDGIRLCKAVRYRYRNRDMADLEAKLTEAAGARRRMIATDGVFSMDGHIAPLADICELADKHDALVMVDDSHATGFIGARGRGTHEYHDVIERIDLITTTFGKALGGASGGCTSGRAQIIEYLRQRSRPYLFSNTLAPPMAAAALRAVELVSESTELRDRLEANTKQFRAGMTERGFNIVPGEHPIVPIMLGDATLASKMADRLLDEGIYVIGFSYPVVPRDKARIRVQLSAAHTREDIDTAMSAFTDVGRELDVIRD